MPMEVTIHKHVATCFQGTVHHGAQCVDFGCLSLPTVVLAVQIEPGQRASGVAVDDAIDVDHGHYFENEVLTEEPGFFAVADQKVDRTFHDVRGLTTSGMHPGRKDDAFSFGDNSGFLIEISNEQSQGFVSRKSRAQRLRSNLLLICWAGDACQVTHQVSICVRVVLRKINLVIVKVENSLKTQRVVGS